MGLVFTMAVILEYKGKALQSAVGFLPKNCGIDFPQIVALILGNSDKVV